MEKTPTSKDVARLAGVAQSTVSYVMSGKRSISAETLRRVEEAMATLNYQPHAGARSLAGHKTSTIAVVMPMHSSQAAQGLMAFVEEFILAARLRDYDVLLVTAQEGVEGLRRVAGRSLCDAVIVMQVGTHDERADLARGLDIPVIFVGVPEDSQGLDCIDFDFEQAGELLVKELFHAGSTRIRVLGWSEEAEAKKYNYITRFRRGVYRAAERTGVSIDWYCSPAASAFAQVPQNELPQVGVVMTQGITGGLRALAEQGLRAGEHLDVVALCTQSEAEDQMIPLTAVSTQPRDVSRRVTDRIFFLMENSCNQTLSRPDQKSRLELVAAEVIRRASTRLR